MAKILWQKKMPVTPIPGGMFTIESGEYRVVAKDNNTIVVEVMSAPDSMGEPVWKPVINAMHPALFEAVFDLAKKAGIL